jgi:hypothetical protein
VCLRFCPPPAPPATLLPRFLPKIADLAPNSPAGSIQRIFKNELDFLNNH